MKALRDILLEKILSNEPSYSLEFFPPRSKRGVANLLERIERMSETACGATFVDVTWNPRSCETSLEICKHILKYSSLNCVLHVTCEDKSRVELVEYLKKAVDFGVTSFMALRGRESEKSQLKTASELVALIKEIAPNSTILVAGYPESENEDDFKAVDAKIMAGADVVVTQLFFDYESYASYCRKLASFCDVPSARKIPVLPGVLPVTLYKPFKRTLDFIKCECPHLAEFEAVKGDDEAVKKLGVKAGAELVEEIFDSKCGVLLPFKKLDFVGKHVHLYTWNLERVATEILKKVFSEHTCVNLNDPLPWKKPQAFHRSEEEIRPIYWANRPKSYVDRTDSWDEFPNGRWGSVKSPAFGELSGRVGHYYQKTYGAVSERRAMWGEAPLSAEEIHNVFADFLLGKVAALPWSESGVAPETSVIRAKLVELNRAGILTINSQPRTNQTPSGDPQFGWGPPNGYVYQKAYIEFFAPPEHADSIVRAIDSGVYPTLTYTYAKAFSDQVRTSSKTGAPCAVTWGVFPDLEVVQPTVSDSAAFSVWKEEAFSLWMDVWGECYHELSSPHDLIKSIHDSYFLINIVDNDFVGGDIFKIFEDLNLV